eukprot:1160631-Pyramimonas_sp.AAC.1
MSRAPPLHALLGDSLKREMNQLTIIFRKSTDGDEKQKINSHFVLIEECLKLSRDGLQKLSSMSNGAEEKQKAAKKLDISGILIPPVVQLDIINFDFKPLLTSFKRNGDTREETMKSMVGLMQPWRRVLGRKGVQIPRVVSGWWLRCPPPPCAPADSGTAKRCNLKIGVRTPATHFIMHHWIASSAHAPCKQ